MAFARIEYFKELLSDCAEAVIAMEIPDEHQGVVIAALIESDSYNGLRKALLQVEANRRTA